MGDTNEGGLAFPRTAECVASENRAFDLNGMTLRDWYFGQAMNGILAAGHVDVESEEGIPTLVQEAGELADAMVLSIEIRRTKAKP